MMMKFLSPLILLLTCLACNVSFGGLVGEPAAVLNIREWIKGGPWQVGPGTNLYVVAIWHVGSPSTTASVATLNEVQKRYETNHVVVLAVSDEAVSITKDFAQRQGTNVQFSLAADNKRYTSLNYMKPVGQRGIPYAFVVGTNGDLLWHGHLGPGLEGSLNMILSGKFDEALAKKMDLARHQMEQYLGALRQSQERGNQAGRMLLEARTNDLALLCDLAFVISTFPNLPHRDLALANEALDQAQKLAKTNSPSVGIGRAFVTFASGKPTDALNLATQVLNQAESPVDRTNILQCIRMMNAELKSPKILRSETNTVATPVPNQPPAKP